jgi:hypothetical protein
MGRTSIGCVQQWDFGLERELPGQTAAKASYVGSRGVHLECRRRDAVSI